MPRLVEIDVIERELAAWRNWQAAFLRGDEDRPSLPAAQASPPPPVLIAAAVARGWLSRALRAQRAPVASTRTWPESFVGGRTGPRAAHSEGNPALSNNALELTGMCATTTSVRLCAGSSARMR